MLVRNQKVTAEEVLGELDERCVEFITLRMRSPGLLKRINALTRNNFK